jgi:hypothetical protein
MNMKNTAANPAHVACRNAMLAAMQAHVGTLRADELLAIAAHVVGQLIAFQDQRAMTPEMAMDLVQKNIAQGNAEAVGSLLHATPGGSA